MYTFKTYVLSLKTDTERREWMKSIQSRIGLELTFFDAVTPLDLTKQDKDKFKHTDFHEWNINHEAVIATFASHLRMLEESVKSNINLLILEDDIDMVQPMEWSSVDFSTFDIWHLTGQDVSCFAYFVSVEGAAKILEYINHTTITQAYDWELLKLGDRLNIKKETNPVFVQLEDRFISNIAPNGYERHKDS